MRTYSVRGIGIAASVAVAVTILLDAVVSLWPVAGRILAERAKSADDPNLLNVATTAEGILSLIWLAIYAIAGVLVIVWFYRARKNVDALPDAQPGMRAGWAIGGWFIPFANLVIPCRVMAHTARSSLSRPRTPALVGIWWAAWLVYSVAGYAVVALDNVRYDALPAALAGPADYQRYVDYYGGALVPNLLALLPGIVAAVALIVLVRRISNAQARRLAAGGQGAPVMPGMSLPSQVAPDPRDGTIRA
ncbi:MAG TPA: DUF4328 domain-containing protein [Micromonosporaceae bacterium]|nr:DUF4328 domain-containing protein [Micromonosporaceae bacterium]